MIIVKFFVPPYLWSDSSPRPSEADFNWECSRCSTENISDDIRYVCSLEFWELFIIQSFLQTYFWEMRIHYKKKQDKN